MSHKNYCNTCHTRINLYLQSRDAKDNNSVYRTVCMSLVCYVLLQRDNYIKICQAKTRTGAQQLCHPITHDALCRIKAAWENEGLNQDKIMLWAAFTICFFGFLRSGEICSGADGRLTLPAISRIEIESIENLQILWIRLKHSIFRPWL